jgi:hypothetical protein
VRYGIFDRPHYAYGVYWAADLARRLGIDTISAVEFGVAGGRGLLALESISAEIASHFGIRIHVCGFDSGEGMPQPIDHRDMPHAWNQGFYKMDVPKLKARLSPNTELVLGDIAETVPQWSPQGSLGFISFDLDYYSSTMTAFRLFDAMANGQPRPRLPRVYSYFDDLLWPENACQNEYTGELRAIREFNEAHEFQKICPVNMLRYMRVYPEAWNEQMYVMHDFKHPLYTKNLRSSGDDQLPL